MLCLARIEAGKGLVMARRWSWEGTESIGSGIERRFDKGVGSAYWVQAKTIVFSREDAFRDRIVAGFLPPFLWKFFR